MRSVAGDILLPPTSPASTASYVLIEVRDVSEVDAPSVVVAQQRLTGISLQPGGHIHFHLQAPEVAPNRSLALRVHISLDGSEPAKPGDLLSTSRYAVPSLGEQTSMTVSVVVI
ncbi:YbaY family lipoprotein [Spirosoma pollinicola]|uniref:Uncharacterized protein n=1 Tax=Spirosoma pollinicola TaxID=2057025 RepID=A0A2K8YYV8_9BACT|nr:YbaY family lipoprotein [Spirosoma pollinicola]AUD02812.1 hypothetical protein CWM47_13805 [Spirosoma pollinicola]